MNKQQAKADAGKPQLTLVPRKVLFDIARVREYGTKKYGDPENWRQGEIQRYRSDISLPILTTRKGLTERADCRTWRIWRVMWLSFAKWKELKEMELTEIMREAQQAINGDYEQFVVCN